MYHGSDTSKDSVKLTSLVLSQAENASCELRFYYYMYGANVGKLTIGTIKYGGDGTENVSCSPGIYSSLLMILSVRDVHQWEQRSAVEQRKRSCPPR